MAGDPRSPDQEVISTVLVNAVLAQDIGNIGAVLDRHRGFFQHQLVVMADAATAAGDWDIYYIPDVDGINKSLKVDVGSNLALAGTTSDKLFFGAALRGLSIVQSTQGTSGRTLTFVLTSTKGQLINA